MLHKNSISLQAAKKAREQEEKQEGRPKKMFIGFSSVKMVGNLSFLINASNCVKYIILASKASDSKCKLNLLILCCPHCNL